MARARLETVPLQSRAEARTQDQRRAGLAGRAGLVPLTFHGQQRRVADRLQAHGPPSPSHLAACQLVLAEHSLDGVEVDLRRYVHDSAELAVEPPLGFGRREIAGRRMERDIPGKAALIFRKATGRR